MTDTIDVYFEALDRLQKDRPLVVPRGTKITNDAVALEAGRGKGSIKKSRPVFSDLIKAIKQAASEQQQQSSPNDDMQRKLSVAKADAAKYRVLWDEALAREASLLLEVYELKKLVMKLNPKTASPPVSSLAISIRCKAARHNDHNT